MERTGTRRKMAVNESNLRDRLDFSLRIESTGCNRYDEFLSGRGIFEWHPARLWKENLLIARLACKRSKRADTEANIGDVMGNETFNDAFMLEIFRSEVETHVETLTSGLLSLERNPADARHIDEMMRGAHSIKGAARIVGIDPAVRIAHVMEDGFIAAQSGKLTLRPEHVDTLLRGVDMLSRIANGTRDPAFDWVKFEGDTGILVAEMTAALEASSPAAVSLPIAAPTAHENSQIKTPGETRGPEFGPSSPVPSNEVTILLPAMFDKVAAEAARREFVSRLDAGVNVIRFDLSQTQDLDATGLSLLVAVPMQVSRGGPRVELTGANTQLQSVLAATGVDRMYSAGER